MPTNIEIIFLVRTKKNVDILSSNNYNGFDGTRKVR